MAKKFDWDKFIGNDKIAVNCKTQVEAEDFCAEMHKREMKWSDGKSYAETDRWTKYGAVTCYTGDGQRGSIDTYRSTRYEVLEWADYMTKEFTKADLKTGMRYVDRAGETRLVLADYETVRHGKQDFIGVRKGGYMTADEYRDDLTCDDGYNSEYDIMEVYHPPLPGDVLDLSKLGKCVWKREEPKGVDKATAEKALAEMYGRPVEIMD